MKYISFHCYKQKVTGIEKFMKEMMAGIEQKFLLIALSGSSSTNSTEKDSMFQHETFVFGKKSQLTHSIPTVKGWMKSSETRNKPGYVAEERIISFVTDAITEISENHLRLAIIEAIELKQVNYQSNSENMLDEKDYLCGFYTFSSKNISNGKNTGSGTKPTLSLYLMQLSTYVPYYLSAFGTILMYSFCREPSDPTHVNVRTISQQKVEHKKTY
jgi:hypothetical protein